LVRRRIPVPGRGSRHLSPRRPAGFRRLSKARTSPRTSRVRRRNLKDTVRLRAKAVPVPVVVTTESSSLVLLLVRRRIPVTYDHSTCFRLGRQGWLSRPERTKYSPRHVRAPRVVRLRAKAVPVPVVVTTESSSLVLLLVRRRIPVPGRGILLCRHLSPRRPAGFRRLSKARTSPRTSRVRRRNLQSRSRSRCCYHRKLLLGVAVGS
jgi:hypothetical protein